jgi:hypothetical protein
MTAMEILIRVFDHAKAHAAPLLGISLAMLVTTLVAFPFVIARLPARYFAERSRPAPRSRHMLVHWVFMVFKNLLGLTLAIAGVLLLFLPGQGLLTLIVGLAIMNYPGKFEIERWLVRRPRVLRALNWLRRRFGVAPFEDP